MSDHFIDTRNLELKFRKFVFTFIVCDRSEKLLFSYFARMPKNLVKNAIF